MPIYLGKAAPHHFEPLDPEDILAVVLFMVVPSFICFLTFLLAGIGLIMRKTWGFFLHIAGSVLAIVSVIFIPYAVVSLIFSFRPAFKNIFFSDHHFSAKHQA
jgi:hypothetical protein